MNKVVYEYSWGDEEILGSLIIITKLDTYEYRIYFEQETFSKPRKLETTFEILDEKHEHYVNSEACDMDVYETWLTIRVILNPAPEELFEIKY
jgi:hypothetical protein